MSFIDSFRQTGVEFSKVQVLHEFNVMMIANHLTCFFLNSVGNKRHSAFILNNLNVYLLHTH